MGDTFLILFQERKGKFGPRVQESIDEYVEIFKHVKIECSSSGKMGKANVQKWFPDVFGPDVREGEGNILLLDSFGRQGENAKLLTLTKKDLRIMYIPKRTTYLCQPCDLGLFRQLKGLIRPIVAVCRVN